MNPPTVTPSRGPSSPKPGATKRPRKAAATATALSDVTNLLPDTRTPLKPRRTGWQPIPQPSDAASTCSSSASVTPTPAPKRSSAAASVTPTPAPKRSAAVASVTPTPTPARKRSAAAASVTPTPALKRSAAVASVTPTPTPTPAPKRSAAAVREDEGSVFKSPAISTVYARRGRGATTAEAEGTERRARICTTDKGKGKEPAVAAAAGTASCAQLGKSTRNRNRKTSAAQGSRPISSSAPVHEAKKKRPSSSTPKLPEDFVKKQRAYFADIDAFELPVEEVSEADLD